MIDPWFALGWVLLVAVALAWVGGVLQLWSTWREGQRRAPTSRIRVAIGMTLALTWPLGLGAVAAQWIEDNA